MNDAWRSLIDEEFPADRSLVLRYHRVFERLDLQLAVERQDLLATSRGEGARIFKLTEYNGVEILVCDESSLMATGTYKDLDACLVTAVARGAGLESVVLSSGGNLGYAMAVYGQATELKTYFFHPASTLYKIDAAALANSNVRLISVDLPEKQVKQLGLSFAKKFCITHVPDIRWRLAASAVRALFLLESTSNRETRVDSLAQAMCAGYGPTGIYNCFSELAREGLLRRGVVPRFLGFQQDGNAPMVRAWASGEREIAAEHVQPRPDQYIEPGLYNTNPERNYTRLFDLIRYYGGDLLSIDRERYERYVPMLTQWFSDAGLEFTRRRDNNEILEKTGLLTGAGILQAIDEGRVHRGERVLYMMTGGFRRVGGDGTPAKPDVVVDDSKSVDDWVNALGEMFGIKEPQFRRVGDRLFRSA